MDIQLNGKRVLVTGGGRGIGKAIALKMVELGAKVFVISKTSENLERLKSEAPAIETRCIDISDWKATRQCVQDLCPIDLLVNNAGINPRACSILEVTKDDIDSLLDVNFKAVFNISQVVAADMISRGTGGSIVNVTSILALRAGPTYSVYCASKAALEMLTKSLAVELAPHKIRANCVAPGPVLTDMLKETLDVAKEGLERILGTIPAGEYSEIDDVVNAVIYLLSDKSKMISGATLTVDGAIIARC